MRKPACSPWTRITADKIGNYKGSLAKKLEVARWVREEGLPLTVNAPTHRHNIKETPALIELAVELGAGRLEIAHIQYYGWAKRNEAALLPPYELVLDEAAIVADAKGSGFTALWPSITSRRTITRSFRSPAWEAGRRTL